MKPAERKRLKMLSRKWTERFLWVEELTWEGREATSSPTGLVEGEDRWKDWAVMTWRRRKLRKLKPDDRSFVKAGNQVISWEWVAAGSSCGSEETGEARKPWRKRASGQGERNGSCWATGKVSSPGSVFPARMRRTCVSWTRQGFQCWFKMVVSYLRGSSYVYRSDCLNQPIQRATRIL